VFGNRFHVVLIIAAAVLCVIQNAFGVTLNLVVIVSDLVLSALMHHTHRHRHSQCTAYTGRLEFSPCSPRSLSLTNAVEMETKRIRD